MGDQRTIGCFIFEATLSFLTTTFPVARKVGLGVDPSLNVRRGLYWLGRYIVKALNPRHNQIPNANGHTNDLSPHFN